MTDACENSLWVVLSENQQECKQLSCHRYNHFEFSTLTESCPQQSAESLIMCMLG